VSLLYSGYSASAANSNRYASQIGLFSHHYEFKTTHIKTTRRWVQPARFTTTHAPTAVHDCVNISHSFAETTLFQVSAYSVALACTHFTECTDKSHVQRTLFYTGAALRSNATRQERPIRILTSFILSASQTSVNWMAVLCGMTVIPHNTAIQLTMTFSDIQFIQWHNTVFARSGPLAVHKLFTSCIRRCLVSRVCDWVMSASFSTLLVFSFQFSLLFFNISIARQPALRRTINLIRNIGHDVAENLIVMFPVRSVQSSGKTLNWF